jgi:hypothetical protein
MARSYTKHIIKGCIEKHGHASRGAAEAQLRSLKKFRPEITYDVYMCPFCNKWHVGRPTQKRLSDRGIGA